MAKYIKQEMPDMNKTGEKKCYYRMENAGNVSTQELIKHICSHAQGLTEGGLLHALTAVSEELSEFLAQGHTVTLDGIGTFRAALGTKTGVRMDGIGDNESSLNSASIEVTDVNFRCDARLVDSVNRRCSLTRGGVRRVNSSPYTKEERKNMLFAYLSEPGNKFIRVAEYAELTGMARSSATVELRKWAETKGSGLISKGKVSAKVYMKE